MTFKEAILAGQIKNPLSEVDNWIHRWHTDKDNKQTLHGFLGMTRREYSAFLMPEWRAAFDIIITAWKNEARRNNL